MFRHPLVKKEWKNIRWIMLLFIFIYTLSALILNQNMQAYKTSYLLLDDVDSIFISEIYRMSEIMLPIILVGIIALVILLFLDDRDVQVGRFIGSLPFSRKEQFIIKYIMGFLIITVPLLIYGVVIWAIRVSHGGWIDYLYKYQPHRDILMKEDSIASLMLWLGLVWLIMLSLYSFLIFIQTLMGQNILAGIIGSIIYLVPLFLLFAIPANIELIFKKNILLGVADLKQFVRLFFMGIPTKGAFYRVERNIAFTNQYEYHYFGYEYRYLLVGILLLIGIIILSSVLAYYFAQWNDVEKIGDIVMYSWVQKVLVLGVTVCSGLVLPIIIVIFTQINNSILTIILMIIGGGLGYIITQKSSELTKKHG